MNHNTLICLDFESSSTCPHTTQPVQLAAVPIDGRRLEIIEDDIFCSDIRPTSFDTIPEDNIEFHCRNRKCTKDELLESWKNAPSVDQVWDSFIQYVDKYNYRKQIWTAPIACGHNIINFDLIIARRLMKDYSKRNWLFHPRDYIDTLNLCFLWFENKNEPRSYGMDNLRPFFGMSSDSAHTADKDVLDCSRLIVKFLKLHRELGKRVKFEGSFSQ